MKGNPNFMCWYCKCKFNPNGKGTRYLFTELKKRMEDINHFDYVCPYCEKVIICSEKEL